MRHINYVIDKTYAASVLGSGMTVSSRVTETATGCFAMC